MAVFGASVQVLSSSVYRQSAKYPTYPAFNIISLHNLPDSSRDAPFPCLPLAIPLTERNLTSVTSTTVFPRLLPSRFYPLRVLSDPLFAHVMLTSLALAGLDDLVFTVLSKVPHDINK